MVFAVIMTLLMIAVCLFFYMKYDRVRTMKASLEKAEGAPVSFSADSGFYEDSFILQLKAHECIPEEEDIEIRYTVNGDDPTGESFLYTDGIDLGEVIRQLAAEEAEEDKEKAAARAEAAAAKEKEEAESKAAEGSAGDTAENSEEAGNTDNADNAQQEDSADEYTVEYQRRQWEKEKNLSVSGNGLYVDQAQDGIYVIPVRARLVQGEDMSDVVTRTYVIGEGVFERYDGYLACLSTDSANLFDYEKGILIRGYYYQKNLEEGVREDRSGNFYQEGYDWIKDGHLTLFSPEGEVLLEEETGISVGGFSSRGIPTKSLRADVLTDPDHSGSPFALDIFKSGSYSRAGNLLKTGENGETGVSGKTTDKGEAETGGKTQDSSVNVETIAIPEDPESFQRLRFRTHGIPTYHIRSVRNQYAKIISDASGFPGLAGARLGIVYLNGKFYTDCDLTPAVTKDYMCRLYGLGTPDAIEKYDSSDYKVYTEAKILPLFNADLTQTENRQALEKAVDMDNYLFYFALEVLLNNCDWPFNNVTMWRYNGETDSDNPYTDGRFRFILDDMDQILTNDLHSRPDQWSAEVFDYLMKDDSNTFYHVMQCKKYRDTFLTYIDDLLQTTFEPEYACEIIDALYADMKREYILDYGQDFWTEMEDTIRKTMNNVREKESLLRPDITKYLGLEERYEVTIEAGEGVSVSWNNMIVNPGGSWSNSYYRGTSLPVTAQPEEGYRFAGWEIKAMSADTGDLSKDSESNGNNGNNGDIENSESGGEKAETLVISDELAASAAESPVHVKVRAVAEPVQ